MILVERDIYHEFIGKTYHIKIVGNNFAKSISSMRKFKWYYQFSDNYCTNESLESEFFRREKSKFVNSYYFKNKKPINEQ